ncbi:hypothetical protein FB451DRAFT_1295702, partial [Mycena latifolia]
MGAAGTRSRYAASSTAGAGSATGSRGRRRLRLLGDRRHWLGERNGPGHLLLLVGERAGVACPSLSGARTTSGSKARTGSEGGADSSGVAGGSTTEGSEAGGSAACGSGMGGKLVVNTLWRRCRAEMRRDAGATSTKRGRITIRLLRSPAVVETHARGCRWQVIVGKMRLESEQSLM